MKSLFLEDELKYFFLRFYWDVCLFTLVKPIIMGVWFSLRHDFKYDPFSFLMKVLWIFKDYYSGCIVFDLLNFLLGCRYITNLSI